MGPQQGFAHLMTGKKNLLEPLREKRVIRDFSVVPLHTFFLLWPSSSFQYQPGHSASLTDALSPSILGSQRRKGWVARKPRLRSALEPRHQISLNFFVPQMGLVTLPARVLGLLGLAHPRPRCRGRNLQGRKVQVGGRCSPS